MIKPRAALTWAVVLAAVMGAAACGYAALPQAKPAQKAAAEDGKEEDRKIKIIFEGIHHEDATGIGHMMKPQAIDGDTFVKADRGDWSTKKKTVELTGAPSMTDPQADGTCERAFIEYADDKKVATMTGSVTILVKPKKEDAPATGPMPVSLEGNKAVAAEKKDDDDSPRKHPATITCDKAVYSYDKKKKYAVLSGNLKIVQKLKDNTRTCTAETAEWFGREEKIILHKPVHLEDTDGNKFDPDGDVTVWTKKGSEGFETGSGKGIVHAKPDKDEESGTPPTKAEPGKPATPTKKP